jgi:hypothetical protein
MGLKIAAVTATAREPRTMSKMQRMMDKTAHLGTPAVAISVFRTRL